ncbi:MAG TPA: hypothetical protein VIM73_21525 [Polyangiaceae bacterium]
MRLAYKSLVIIGVLGVLGTVSVPCQAQSDEQRAAARIAATQGIEAFEAGKYAESVDLLERAQSLVHAPTHLLYLARANEKLGKLVKAREAYLKLSREELGPRAPRVFRNAVADGAKELAALEPRIAYVTVRVLNADASSVELTENEVPVSAALVGIEKPTDPGTVVFTATAPGFHPATARIELAEGARETVELELQKDPQAVTASDATGASDGTGRSAGVSGSGGDQATSGSSSGSVVRPLAYVSLGLAAVGIGVGTYFLVDANEDWKKGDQLFADCDPGCSDQEKGDVLRFDADGDKKAKFAAGGFIAGGVFLATAVTLLVLPTENEETASIQPWVGLNSFGVHGRF